ncbi:MAG: glycoside hydrolase family 3 N-terminal domain-containing protein [Fidelibacterota bacterium]|jgi:beta-N-acetylhexosaminidase
MTKSIKQEIGQLIIAGFRGTSINKESDIVKFINDYNLGGVILYDEDLEIGGSGSRNISSPKQLKKLVAGLQSITEKSLLIAVDQEGGEVERLRKIYGFSGTPSWNQIGLLNSKLMTKQFAEDMVEDLSSMGINLNFAPVIDLDYGVGTVISDTKRAFSHDTEVLIEHTRIFSEVHRSKNIITSGKHFPGLGSANTDTHEGYTDITETWSVKDLHPFNELIKSKDLDTIMVSHALDKKLDDKFPASLSKKIIQGMLREDLGFNGIIICDDPSMRAISDHYSLKEIFKLMINAGVDLFCLGNNLIYDKNYIPKSIEAITKLVENNEVSMERIRDSIKRINTIKLKYGLDV